MFSTVSPTSSRSSRTLPCHKVVRYTHRLHGHVVNVVLGVKLQYGAAKTARRNSLLNGDNWHVVVCLLQQHVRIEGFGKSGVNDFSVNTFLLQRVCRF